MQQSCQHCGKSSSLWVTKTEKKSSVQRLVDAHVTGFTNKVASFVIYMGSTLWIVLLILLEALALGNSSMWQPVEAVLIASIVYNAATWVSQTIDFAFFHFHLWALTSILWTTQLGAIANAAVFLSYAVGTSDSDRDGRIQMASVHLAAQVLFTASQFSVTLEYFERSIRMIDNRSAEKVYVGRDPNSIAVNPNAGKGCRPNMNELLPVRPGFRTKD